MFIQSSFSRFFGVFILIIFSVVATNDLCISEESGPDGPKTGGTLQANKGISAVNGANGSMGFSDVSIPTSDEESVSESPQPEGAGAPSGNIGISAISEETDSTGFYAVGTKYGIYAEEVGVDSDVGIYTPDYVHALGFRSTSDSYIFVPATAGCLASSGGAEVTIYYYGKVAITDPTPGTEYFYIPITVPGVLFGQETTVENIRVYYKTTNSASYITRTALFRATGASAEETLIDDTTNRTSTTDTYYSLTAAGATTFSSDSGPLQLQLQMSFASATHTIHIGFVRVEFGHQPVTP